MDLNFIVNVINNCRLFTFIAMSFSRSYPARFIYNKNLDIFHPRFVDIFNKTKTAKCNKKSHTIGNT